jgi:hypothetical protein
MTATDTNPIPQPLLDAAEQAGLTLTRTDRGALQLSNTQGQGMLFTSDFEHEIPEWCADHGAKFKKRFQRDDDIEPEAKAEPDDADDAAAEEEDEEDDDQPPVKPLVLDLAHAIDALIDDLRDDLEYRIGELEEEVAALQQRLRAKES